MELTYSMEELIPVWEDLTRKYCGYESTSLSYEKAQQLMEAVIYCIQEWENYTASPASLVPSISGKSLSARKAYEEGLRLVKEKTLRLKDLYHSLLPVFDSYGMKCLEDTVYQGIPEFFRWYDIQYHPQDTILTLDYPVCSDLSSLTGVDAAYEYVLCICKEQRFLRQYPPDEIRAALSRYSRNYKDLIENIPRLIFPDQSSGISWI